MLVILSKHKDIVTYCVCVRDSECVYLCTHTCHFHLSVVLFQPHPELSQYPEELTKLCYVMVCPAEHTCRYGAHDHPEDFSCSPESG